MENEVMVLRELLREALSFIERTDADSSQYFEARELEDKINDILSRE